MSRSTTIYAKTSGTAASLALAFREELRGLTDRAADYYINFFASDADEKQDCELAYGFQPDVSGVIAPPAGDGDDLVDRALLAIAWRQRDMEVLATLDGTPILSIWQRILWLPQEEKEFFTRWVLPFSSFKVAWGGALPWSGSES